MMNEMNPKEEYYARCAVTLQKTYAAKSIWVRVTAHSAIGEAWFDNLVGAGPLVEIHGIDLEAIPQIYLTEEGAIPFACAEFVRRGEGLPVSKDATNVDKYADDFEVPKTAEDKAWDNNAFGSSLREEDHED